MNPPRTPVVLGIEPGVGATTLAAALHAHDGGPGDTAADVVVCARSAALLELGLSDPRPLLAVVATVPGPDATGRYVLPLVERWRGLAAPTDEVTTLLGRHPELLPPELRAYAAGVREIVAGLLRSGVLHRDRPPSVTRPGPAAAAPLVPAPRAALDDLDRTAAGAW